MTQPANIEEYRTFRQELQTVINLKYTVLSIIIAAFGIITTIILRTEVRADLAPWTPLLYSAVLLPGMFLNLFLTIQHRILDGFLMAAFDEAKGSEFVFQRAYEGLEGNNKVKWWWRVYSIPLASTYATLSAAAIVLSLVLNINIHTCCLQYGNPCPFIIGLILLFIGATVFSCLVFCWATRNLARRIKDSWKKEIEKVHASEESKTDS